MRYAKALFLLASAHGTLERVRGEAAAMARQMGAYAAVGRVLCSPEVDPGKKGEVVRVCTGGETSPEFGRFVELVLENGRGEWLRTMCMSFLRLEEESRGVTDAVVTLAEEPDGETTQKLRGELERRTGGKVNMEVAVDPQIIGGYILRWDTYRLDRSVRTSLQQIEKYLTRTEL